MNINKNSKLSCGIAEFYDLEQFYGKLTKEEFILLLKKTFTFYDKAHIKEEVSRTLIVNLISDQKLEIKFVESLGFKKIYRFNNPKTGNWNNLFALDLHKFIRENRKKLMMTRDKRDIYYRYH